MHRPVGPASDRGPLGPDAAAALVGPSRAVIVEGARGSGKTALLDRFLHCADNRFAVLAHRCTAADAQSDLHTANALFGHMKNEPDTRKRPGTASAGAPAVISPHENALRVLQDFPLAVLVDDSHWCDGNSLRLLSALLHETARQPLFLVLTRESGAAPADPVFAEIAAHRRCRLVAMAGAADRPQPPRGALHPGHVRTVAAAVAVLGDSEPRLVSGCCGLPLATTRSALAHLGHAGASAVPGSAAVSAADMHRYTGELADTELVRLRLRAARLHNDAGRPAGDIADHLLALPHLADPWMPEILLDAAATAEHDGARPRAARYLARLAAAQPERAGVRLLLARALVGLDPERAATEAAGALHRAADPGSRRRAVALLTIAANSGRGPHQAVRLVTRALTGSAGPAVPGSEARTLAALAAGLLSTNRAAAVEAARSRLGPPDPPGLADPHVAHPPDLPQCHEDPIGMLRGPAAVAEPRARSLLRPGAAAPGHSLVAAAVALHAAGDLPGGLQALDTAIAGGAATGDRRTMSQALGGRALLLRDSGDADAAAADTRAATLVLDPGIDRSGATLARLALAGELYYAEEHAAAEGVLEAMRHCRALDHRWEEPLRLLWAARLRAVRGDVETALRLLAECGRLHERAAINNPVFAPWWFDSALLLGSLQLYGAARDHLEYGRDLARTWSTAHARGLLLLAEGAATPAAAAVEILEEARRDLAASNRRLEHARAEYLLGRSLLQLDHRKKARHHLRQAALLATNTGWSALGRAARETLAGAGGRMRRAVPHRANLLTARELEVAETVARGMTNRDAAAALFVSVRTVELHLTNIYRKLAVDSRSELAAALGGGAATAAHVPHRPTKAPGRCASGRWRQHEPAG
ncbi:hypothetical protein GCM10027570_06320 [Streptomonospora sediminis]